MFLMFATFFGFGMAATVLIGQSVGRGDVDAARRAAGGAIGLALLFSVVIAVTGWFASDAILRLLETPAEAFALAHDYLRVTFIAIPRSEEHTSELQSLMRNSYAVFCLKKKIKK